MAVGCTPRWEVSSVYSTDLHPWAMYAPFQIPTVLHLSHITPSLRTGSVHFEIYVNKCSFSFPFVLTNLYSIFIYF